MAIKTLYDNEIAQNSNGMDFVATNGAGDD